MPGGAAPRVVLTINGGSSSIKFAVYVLGAPGAEPQRGLAGQLDRIGQPGARLTVRESPARPPTSQAVEAADQPAAGRFLLDWLAHQPVFATVQAVGHRVVHGGLQHQARKSSPPR